MGTSKDAFDIGREMLQFWTRFKGRRVRVWPSELTMRICMESRRMWVRLLDASLTAENVPPDKPPASDALAQYAMDHLIDPEIPNVQTVASAQLFEATVSDVVKQPPGIYFTDIQYWVEKDGKGKVEKIDSIDEGIFLPLDQLSRIDFINIERRKEQLEEIKRNGEPLDKHDR